MVPEIKVQQTEIFVILCHLTTQKPKILKLKKTPGDIIILQVCTINDNYMMYGSCDMEPNRQNFLSFCRLFREEIGAYAAVHKRYVMDTCNCVRPIILLPPMMGTLFVFVALKHTVP